MLVVRRVRVTAHEAADIFGDLARHAGMHGVDAARGPLSLLPIAEHHAENGVESALKTAERVTPSLRMLIDGVRHIRMSKLEQRRLAAPQKQNALLADLPGEALRTVDPRAGIPKLGPQLREPLVQLRARNAHALAGFPTPEGASQPEAW